MALIPIEKRKLCLETNKPINALDREWLLSINFLPYEPPSNDNVTEAALEEWTVLLDFMTDDLETVLKSPSHVFWSHLIFDDSFRLLIDSFLRNYPRDIDNLPANDSVKIKTAHKRLYHLFFRVILRATTCKESKVDFFTPSAFGEILYSNFIFDIPKIMDICTLYGTESGKLVSKLAENIFKNQPKFRQDLHNAIPLFRKVISDGIDKLNKKTGRIDKSAAVDDSDIMDLILYLTDIIYSVYMFTSMCQSTLDIFHDQNFYSSLTECYENGFVILENKLQSLSARLPMSEVRLLYGRLKHSKNHCIQTYRLILYNSTLDRLVREVTIPNRNLVETFFNVINDSLGDNRFIVHYESEFPLSSDLDTILSTFPDFDSTRSDYILSAIQSAQREYNQHETELNARLEQRVDECSLGAAALPPDNSSISDTDVIKEMFPDYSETFIQACLQHFNTSATVINALLEENLPYDLAVMDRFYKEPVVETMPLLDSRTNIYDHDQFDILHNKQTDTSNMYKGKNKLQRSEIPTSQDEELKWKIREAAEAVSDDEYDRYGLEYEDEYDDTYDSNDVGANDADETVELMGRQLVTPLALRDKYTLSASRDDSPSVTQESERPSRDDPPPNTNGAIPKRPPQNKPKHDVKGGPKGRGQSGDVLRNRAWKTAHKGRGANHNRKAGAQSKLNKGMF